MIKPIPTVEPKSDAWMIETIKGLLEDAVHNRITLLEIKTTINEETFSIRIESAKR